MSRDNQREWYPAKREPVGCFMTADGKMRSDRVLAGALRMGTAPGVGPSGPTLDGRSDFRMDRISPRGCDPLGTSVERYVGKPPQPDAKLISKEIRSYKRDKKY